MLLNSVNDGVTRLFRARVSFWQSGTKGCFQASHLRLLPGRGRKLCEGRLAP